MLSDASKSKMQAARVLIEEKRYSEARGLLQGIDHPTATNWILQIDRLLGEPAATPKPQPLSQGRMVYGGMSLLAFVVFAFAMLYMLVLATDYYAQAIAGLVAFMSLLATYAFNKSGKRA